MSIIGTHHTGFSVSNLERSLAFYVDQLGFEILWQREITEDYFGRIVGYPGCVVKAAHLQAPNSTHVLELFEYTTPPGNTIDKSSPNPGIAHVCYLVQDIHGFYENLKAKGVSFRSSPVLIDQGVNAGAFAIYLEDPDGIAVEFLQRP